MIEAKVIADSIYEGHRLTTLEVEMNRFVLAEFNTHRMFSRSSASSRAIPFPKQVRRVTEDIAFPAVWAAEQPGMQGGGEIADVEQAMQIWEDAREQAVASAEALWELGVHKSIVNRLLEPFMWHRVIVSSTQWENFFRQRCSPLAQPEIRLAAEAMRAAMAESTPRKLRGDEWHLPYVWDDNDLLSWYDDGQYTLEDLKAISVARCARVSYLTHDGKRDPNVDIGLYEKLITADPPHWAPLEHVAQPAPIGATPCGNFFGWNQLRFFVEIDRGMYTKD